MTTITFPAMIIALVLAAALALVAGAIIAAVGHVLDRDPATRSADAQATTSIRPASYSSSVISADAA